MDTFDFAGNADFQAFLDRVDNFDPNDTAMRSRLQRKWYAKHEASSTGSAPPRQSQPAPRAASASSAPNTAPPVTSGRGAMISLIIMGLQVATVVLTLLSVLGFISGGFGFAVRAAFACQTVMWAAMLYRDTGSSFSLSTAFLEIAFRQDAAHYLVYCFMFLSAGSGFLPLVPLSIYSFFNSIVPMSQRYPAYFSRIAARVEPLRGPALAAAVQLEVLLLPYLIISIFLGGSFITPFGHFQFLKFRYMLSGYSRIVIDKFVRQLDGLMSRVPVVSPYYFKVRNWLALPAGPQ